MKILYYASMLAGELDPPEACRDEDAVDPPGVDKSSQRTVSPTQTVQVSLEFRTAFI